MNIIKPKNLKDAGHIRIIAPCGNTDKDKIINGREYLESLGYKVTLGEHIYNQDRYLAGTDKERAKDLEDAFSDNSVDAIICARGGYGAIRLIDKIDYNIIKNNPKIFCGYSDVTVLSAAILKNTGLITYSAPMIQTDFQKDNTDDFTISNFFKMITGQEQIIKPQSSVIYKDGIAKGILWGGNLATIASLCGTNCIPNTDFVFFTEDLNEPTYKIDRYFRQLINTDAFKNNIKGIIFGEFMDCDNYEYLEKLFSEISHELDIPAFGGYEISHGNKKLTIPIGAKAQVDSAGILIKD